MVTSSSLFASSWAGSCIENSKSLTYTVYNTCRRVRNSKTRSPRTSKPPLVVDAHAIAALQGISIRPRSQVWYLSCLNLHAAFAQPMNSLMESPCTYPCTVDGLKAGPYVASFHQEAWISRNLGLALSPLMFKSTASSTLALLTRRYRSSRRVHFSIFQIRGAPNSVGPIANWVKFE